MSIHDYWEGLSYLDLPPAVHNLRVPNDGVESKDKWTKLAPPLEDLMYNLPEGSLVADVWTSFFYVARDSLLALVCGLAFHLSYECTSGWLLSGLLILAYSIIQGTVLTGLWVLGHECGHGAFASSKWVCDGVGLIIHTGLLVPYFSWQYTHGKHHKYTNHLILGESHVPPLHFPELETLVSYIPCETLGKVTGTLFNIILHLFLGWPIYLFTNKTGGRVTHTNTRFLPSKSKSHFNPFNSNIFPSNFLVKVLISSLALLMWLTFLCFTPFSWMTLLVYYFCPVLVVNGWLVLYTWLHHTSLDIPHFGYSAFTWYRGCLATVDRPYPAYISWLHHHIGSTHVAHHLCYGIPHYKAELATLSIRKTLGPYYRYDATSIWEALYKTGRDCHRVHSLEGVAYLHTIFT